MKNALTLIAIGCTLACLGGCNLPDKNQAKVEAYNRWYLARAKVLYGLAQEHLKVGQLDKAQSKASEALALEEDFSQARLLLARVYLEQGRYDQAVKQLGRLANEEPRAAEVHYLLGVAHEKSGDLEQALACYRRAQGLSDDNVPAILAAAEVLVNMNRPREAQIYIESYLPIAGSEVGMYELAGRVAVMLEEHKKGAEYYEQALALRSGNTGYREALARAQFQGGQYAEAVSTLSELTERDEYETPEWIWTTLGDCYMQLGRARDARDAYYMATELSPAEPGVWSKLANAALGMDDLARAILASRQAVALAPDNLDAVLVLGYALVRDGQSREAIGVLTRATAEHPTSGMLQCVLGRAYASAGEHTQARECYAAALEIDPDNELARRLLESAGSRVSSIN